MLYSNSDTVNLSLHIPEIVNPDSIDLEEFYWEYNGNDFPIEYGRSYTLEVNAEIDANTSTRFPSIGRHLIPEAAGVDSFRVKFICDTDFYTWIIDDVQLIEPERNNLRVMENCYAIAPNAIMPASQVEPFSFLADVYNAGSATQTNVNLTMTIDDQTSAVFRDTLAYGDISADVLVLKAL